MNTVDPAAERSGFWTTDAALELAPYRIPVGAGLNAAVRPDAGLSQDAPGVRPRSARRQMLMKLALPVLHALERAAFVGHEIVWREIGQRIRRSLQPGQVLLDVGACDFRMRRYVRSDATYSAIDLAYSEFQLRRVLWDNNVKIAIAKATEIPLPDASCDIAISIEVLYQIPEIDAALAEIFRVLKPGGRLLASIGNPFSAKYQKIGLPWFIHHKFDRPGFRARVEQAGFRVLEEKALGQWHMLPILKRSIHLPITAADDKHNCYFVFEFEKPA